MKQAIRQRRSKVNRKINDYAKELEKKILANHEKLKTTFDEHLSQKRFQLKDTISSIESLLEKASSNIDKLDCISDELSISKTFIKEDAIINKLEDIESETYKGQGDLRVRSLRRRRRRRPDDHPAAPRLRRVR